MKKKLELTQVTTNQMLGLMLLAYAFSFAIRLIWVSQFQGEANYMWNGELMINTNDGYFFAAGAQQALEGLHMENPRVFGMWDYGVIFFTTLFVKITPFPLETVTLYMPSVISSLVVIPIILIARLYKQTMWGFFAALLGSITWSYYNRTMTGYYDTDMFSAMAPMFILFFLMKSTMDSALRSALYAGIAIVLYPFFYDQGLAIVYGMGIIYALYVSWSYFMFLIFASMDDFDGLFFMKFMHSKIFRILSNFARDTKSNGYTPIPYASLILIFLSLVPLVIERPYNYLIHISLLVLVYLFLKTEKPKEQFLQIVAGVLFILFLYFGNVFGLIWGKIAAYVITGTSEDGLHFYAVNQTIREAGSISFETFSNRISGSGIGLLIAAVGYVVLVMRNRAFILALPLVAIGVFALFGGLRFTVYAVPIAAMSAVYLFWVVAEMSVKEKLHQYLFMGIMTAGLIYPNIIHIIDYRVPTVFTKAEVEDLVKLNEVSSPKDYTLSWWDFGYPIWYYSDTSTLIDGGKHDNDNFIISKIMFSTSPTQVANLSRLAVETYVDNNFSIVTNTLFSTKENPKKLLTALKSPNHKLPPKTRDVFLFMPYKMMRIFPTVGVFGNLDLLTGKKERQIIFYPSSIANTYGSKVELKNGIVYDMSTGTLTIGGDKAKVNRFDVVEYRPDGKSNRTSSLNHMDGTLCVVFMKSYNSFVVMDKETYNSAYVQMFMLDNHDPELFELVVSSVYAKTYRVKK
ncbi:MAG: peptide-binding protein [Sulfurovaceae bacterium]|nr:peptide-binding protein [Sulfurovaceae bacterium]